MCWTVSTYNTSGKGPKTEPCGPPQTKVEEDLNLKAVTENNHSDKNQENHSKADPDAHIQYLNLPSTMVMVSGVKRSGVNISKTFSCITN